MVQSASESSRDLPELTGLFSLKLAVRSCPLGRYFVSLLFNCGRRDFHSMRQRQRQKLEDTFRRGAVTCNDIFVIKDQWLDLVFAKIIRPVGFVRCDAVAPFINYLEVEFRCGVWSRCDSSCLRPEACLACYFPRDCLLNSISSAHPDVLWSVA